ncbi:hypothetical protein VNI00_004561 [Paramarasmius palmivorus]|uniref:Metal homeostatis protein BSD2 n=1 Tax=Paramarasmius palmivorus TaxID=297713 RepID=A0AAW0DJ09_9AGAR
MPAGYSPLQRDDENNDELNAAFNGSEDSEDESTPLNPNQVKSGTPAPVFHSRASSLGQANAIPGAYDFEKDYDYDHPPPGSPPGPSAFALPNDHGNSNGLLPASPVRPQLQGSSQGGRRGFFRKVVGAILPTHYARIPTEDQGSGRRMAIGGGVDNDGVFANVMAKPQPAQVIEMPDGNVHLVPEDVQKEAPPSYQSAQADAVPSYFETTIVAPGGAGDPGSDMIIEDLPSGSVLVFVINMLLSFFFQFIGFLLTFLLHTSHAGKYGSRAGLGLTLIQYGYYSRSLNLEYGPQPGDYSDATGSGGFPDQMTGMEPTTTLTGESPVVTLSWNGTRTYETQEFMQPIPARDWLSFLLMTIGWFLLLTSFVGFWRVKRWESSIRKSAGSSANTASGGTPGEQPYTREQLEQEQEVRRNLETVFGISFDPDTRQPLPTHTVHVDEHGHTVVVPSREYLEEMRLTRDLRAAGLL